MNKLRFSLIIAGGFIFFVVFAAMLARPIQPVKNIAPREDLSIVDDSTSDEKITQGNSVSGNNNVSVFDEEFTLENSSFDNQLVNDYPVLKPDAADLFLVRRVIDGDTIELSNGTRVRYIGIDTPESVYPASEIECYGKEASNKNKELVEGKYVKLEKDVSEIDRYGRLLRYVWVGDIFVNDYLVREGYAYIYTYPPDVKYSGQFLDARREARRLAKGLWGGCNEYLGVIEPGSGSENDADDKNIVCTNNVYNCSDFLTHAEAQLVFEKCGGPNNDVHRLDADHDGLVCESLP